MRLETAAHDAKKRPFDQLKLARRPTRGDETFGNRSGLRRGPYSIERNLKVVQLSSGHRQERKRAAWLEADTKYVEWRRRVEEHRRCLHTRHACPDVEVRIPRHDEIHRPARHKPFLRMWRRVLFRQPEYVDALGQRRRRNVDVRRHLAILILTPRARSILLSWRFPAP